MRQLRLVVMITLMASFTGVLPVRAQDAGAAWRALAEQLAAGSEVRVRLENGQRFDALFLEARADSMLVQPKTRIPVAVQAVRYEDIARLERRDRKGVGVGKAVAIGTAAGGATFLGILLFLMAAFAD
jgi:hypothetical protein